MKTKLTVIGFLLGAAYIAYAACSCPSAPVDSPQGTSADWSVDLSSCAVGCSGDCYAVRGAPAIKKCGSGGSATSGCKLISYISPVYKGQCYVANANADCGCQNLSPQATNNPNVKTAENCTCAG